MNKLLNSGILRQNPAPGTFRFAVLYFGVSFILDWMFRWAIGQNPMPPVWTILMSIGGATAISSLVVYLLLSFNRRQREALEELNHELRNALQILVYASQQCDDETQPKALAAIDSMSDSLRRVTQRLGAVSEREFRPATPRNGDPR